MRMDAIANSSVISLRLVVVGDEFDFSGWRTAFFASATGKLRPSISVCDISSNEHRSSCQVFDGVLKAKNNTTTYTHEG
jgi:hypothetical protein